MESFKLGGVVDHFSKVYTFPLAFDAWFLHARYERTLARLDDAVMLRVGRICGVTSSANGYIETQFPSLLVSSQFPCVQGLPCDLLVLKR